MHFTDQTFTIGLRAALFDAVIGQYLQVVKGPHTYSLLEALASIRQADLASDAVADKGIT